MITGVVFEINGTKAIVMKNDGTFETVRAKKDWEKGDVITLNPNMNKWRPFYTVAAAFVLLISLGITGYAGYYQETSLVSMDVNPSIELSLNRFERVIKINSKNKDGQMIIDQTKIKNKRYNEALGLLFSNESMIKYMDSNAYVVFSVHSNKGKKDKILLSNLKSVANTYITKHNENIEIEYSIADAKTVEQAHHYGVTAGKYKVILDLKTLAPETPIEEYSHCSIKEIKEQIDRCGHKQDTNTPDSHKHHREQRRCQ